MALAQLPLLRDPWFYYTDDAATQVFPMWHHLGEQVLSGHWPLLLDLHSWMGGNLAVEALFGVWNPANAVLWVFVSISPNLALAALVVRTVTFVALAMGCYGLAREYGAARWASSAVAVTLPFCGSLFYFDAPKWPAALVAGVWIPYLWWAGRRMARGETNAIWVFTLGALAVTAGNPYTMLAVCIVLLGLIVERAVLKSWRSVRDLIIVSAAIGCVAPLVYLPLVFSSNVTWRGPSGIGYSGVLTPHLRDLVNSSIPSYVPGIPNVFDAAVYFCWFAFPLAMWLDWGVLRRRWRELTGVLVVGALFLFIARGPSEMWMFRWPLRVVHYGYLAGAVLLAVLLSAGLRTDHFRRRVAGMAALAGMNVVLVYLTAQNPQTLHRDALSLVVLALLTVAAVWAYHKRGARWLVAVLHLGTAITFALQVFWFLGYHGATPYYFPTSAAQARAGFEHRYTGQVMQVADTNIIGPPDQPREAWRDLLPGNLYQLAGVDTLSSYTGMGFRPFSDATCMRYAGQTCPQIYPFLWQVTPGTGVPLADLLRLDTVVVQRKLIDAPSVPAGWRVSERNDRVTVIQRTTPASWPGGRLSWTTPGLRTASDSAPDDRHEVVHFTRDGRTPARLIFSRLAWPGYTATAGDVELPTRVGPAGLLEVDLPPGVNSGQIDIAWAPPGMRAGLAIGAAGLLAAVALGAIQRRSSVTRHRNAEV